MTENSVIATDRSIVVVNNFGYRGFDSIVCGITTEPGHTRIDLDVDGNGCHIVWTNVEGGCADCNSQAVAGERAYYHYTKPKGPETTDAFCFTAIDFWTGETVYRRLTGTGYLYNAAQGVITLSPDGRAVYVGLLAGVVKMEDGR